MFVFSLDAHRAPCYFMGMERRVLNYNECFLQIHGTAEAVLRQLPASVSALAVAPDTPDACKIPDLRPGGRGNLAHLRVNGQRVIVSGCAPAVAFLLPLLVGDADSSLPDASLAVSVLFLTTPCAAPVRRAVTCSAPRPVRHRRGHQFEFV